ncbi:membrane protein [Leptolyngbya sp. Heron Island J]|uniref:divergent PAP2 family protein n=1 Tax=Leptolyngbya sp. Heron Island J TaxID=1385935 RepID=UPI0003B9569B|nr:divergent PAP2 family protein [Leptolyngbya sp. Heron Island J]ESA37551.1 membrane protein [Leptolyngbya sp. Heron Island J]
MEAFSEIFQNHVLVVSLVACLSAQLLKLIIEVITNHRLNFRVLVETGGMPSSHSALVTALACGIGQTIGWSSPAFAVTAVFAVIVMYDAAGVRQAAGKQARVLNQIVDEFFQEHEFQEDRLKELLGHTPVQVIAGAALGVFIGLLAAPAY